MKVGLVCPYDMGRPGGVQDQVVRLSRWLADAGHATTVVAPGSSDLPGFISAGPATVVRANGSAVPLALHPDAVERTVSALEGVDVIHVHEPLMPQVSLAVLRHAHQPLVGTFHADVSAAASLFYSVGRPLTGRWLRRLDVITAVSPIAAGVVDYTRRVRIIPNGIDVDDYAPGRKVPESVVFLGRDDPRKGLPVLLDAWPVVRERHPRATLTVLGAQPPPRPVAGVTFAGRVSEPDKQATLGASWVYCAPNLSGESFGIVIAEAMAAGCAVVASGLPAFARVLRDGGVIGGWGESSRGRSPYRQSGAYGGASEPEQAIHTSLLVAPGDSQGLARAISTLLDQPGRVAALGVAARDAVRRFDGAIVAKQYVAAYEDAMRARGGTSGAARR